MNIVKKLSLNKTPKDVENNSIVGAKNMMIDDTGSFLTNEIGFNVAFECPNEHEFIVGVIPCTDELVIFTYNYMTKVSSIYRYNNKVYHKVATAWQYNGGKLLGTYTYNYKKELIIAVAEYDAYDVYGHKLLVPLKSWNLDNNNSSVDYNIEPNIPKYNCSYKITSDGSLLSGVYTFFIRYVIDDNSYTKWFQLTDDIIIINQISKELPNHTYLDANDNLVSNSIDTDSFANFVVNDNGITDMSILLNIDAEDDILYKEYQIGYIYKRNSEVLGRIKNIYKASNKYVRIYDNSYSEEISVDDLLETPHQFYNVKSIANYNNRLYIANYDEYRQENLTEVAKNIIVTATATNAKATNVPITYDVFKLSLRIGGNSVPRVEFDDILDIESTETDENTGITYYYIRNPKQWVYDNIACVMSVYNSRFECDMYFNQTYYKFDAANETQVTYDFALGVGDKTTQKFLYIYATNGEVDNFRIRIKDDNGYHLEIVSSGGDVYNLGANPSDQNNAVFNTLVTLRVQDYKNNVDTTIRYWYWGEEDGTLPPTVGTIITAIATKTSYSSVIHVENNQTTNNNRTLIPYQKYSFYAHYIRKDFSHTDGFPINVRWIPNNGSISNPIIVLNVSNITIPTNYIGCFLTYEKIEQTSIPVICIDDNDGIGSTRTYSNTNFQNNGDSIYGAKLDGGVNGYGAYNPEFNLTNKQITTNRHTNPSVSYSHTIVDTSTSHNYPTANSTHFIVINNTEIYNKSAKTLYRITQNIYNNVGEQDNAISEDNKYMHLPGFYNTEKIIKYNGDYIISPTASYVLTPQGNKTTYNMKLYFNNHYNFIPTNAYSIKQDYNQGAVVLTKANGNTYGVFYNNVISPDRLKDLLEIKACYTALPSKSYTNYSKNHTDNFSKTIYRSDIVSDESLVNGFRHFAPDNYKNILENKGDIVNIVGIGLYFIVHTKYSLFVFDRTPKLTKSSQLDIPDVFSIDYQDVMPSNEGFGGLDSIEESILTKHGYIWFDKINKYIFKYENSKAAIISADIHNFIKHLDIDTVRFAEDLINNRLLVCIYLNKYLDDDNKKQEAVTLSYNFNTNTFISLHDYTFTDNFRTYKNSYFLDKYKDRKRLYVFDKNSNTYKNLKNDYTVCFPKYEVEEETTINQEEITENNAESQNTINIVFEDSSDIIDDSFINGKSVTTNNN